MWHRVIEIAGHRYLYWFLGHIHYPLCLCREQVRIQHPLPK